ncbi:amino acid ABC transporter permease [Angelakisella massiliensis]|uniref:amino acid ABC transporter permease n=1 Tax=Angelakisella massiliensis TaxID=1871018 RepID=UPI0008F83EF9|nr:amino acid ABC transporter permease [Angelakisella massiliensis]
MLLDFGMMGKYMPYLFRSLQVTLQLTAASLLLGILLAIPLSLIKLSRFRAVRAVGTFYTSIFRGVPLLVQIFIVYFGLPQFGLTMDAFQAGCVTFALNSAAYISESLRGGIMAVDAGQREAAMALGISYGKTMKDIIFPQAIKSVMPSLVNEFIGLLKNTTLISTIGLVDVLRAAQMIVSDTFRAFEPLLTAAVFYYVMVMAISFLGKKLEKWVNKSDLR